MPKFHSITLNGASASAGSGTAKTGFEDWSNFTAFLINSGSASSPSYTVSLFATYDGTYYASVGDATMAATSTCVILTVDALLLRAKAFKVVMSDFQQGSPQVTLVGTVGD